METGDDKKPDLKIVSTKSSDEIDAKRVLDEARHAVTFTRDNATRRLHGLTANLLRVIAGAGAPGRRNVCSKISTKRAPPTSSMCRP